MVITVAMVTFIILDHMVVLVFMVTMAHLPYLP